MSQIMRPLDSLERWTQIKDRARDFLRPGQPLIGDNYYYESYLLTITLVGFICSRYCPNAYREEVRSWNIKNLKTVEEWNAFLEVVVEKYYPAEPDDERTIMDTSLDDQAVFIATMCGLTFSKYCPPECKTFMVKQTIEDLWSDVNREGLAWKMFAILRKSVRPTVGEVQ